jgi:protein SCO1/2
MRAAVLALGMLAASVMPAGAALLSADLQKVDVAPVPGARLPLDSQWRDESGASVSLGEAFKERPALLLFADYTCTTLCGPTLTFVGDALAKSGLNPSEYRLVVLGLDPKDGPFEAAVMKRERISTDAVTSSAIFLTGGQAAVQQAADAVGYHYAYDAEHDQFAHSAAVLVLAPDGRVTRALSGLGLSANDLRLALVEAGQGRIGSFADHVRLLCYGFDPSIGAYTPLVYRGLAYASAFSFVILALGIGWLSTRPYRA